MKIGEAFLINGVANRVHQRHSANKPDLPGRHYAGTRFSLSQFVHQARSQNILNQASQVFDNAATISIDNMAKHHFQVMAFLNHYFRCFHLLCASLGIARSGLEHRRLQKYFIWILRVLISAQNYEQIPFLGN
jgi:hypothetical protein